MLDDNRTFDNNSIGCIAADSGGIMSIEQFKDQLEAAMDAEGWVGETPLDMPTLEELHRRCHEIEMLDIHNSRELAKYFDEQNEKDAKALQQRKDDYNLLMGIE